MNFFKKSLAGVFLALSAEALKVGILSDIHLHLRYDQDYGPRLEKEGDCFQGAGVPSTERAPMGRYKCDSPTILVE